MFRHIRPVWAEIDLDNIAYNMQQIRRCSKSDEIIGVVKADAYGHGAVDVAPVLLENGANRLAVAVISEAVELRKSGIQCPIMILGYTPLSLVDSIIKYSIEQTVFSYDYAEKLSEAARQKNITLRIHIALDTGMGRIGFLPTEESVWEVYKISKLSNIIIEGIFSHFSTSDETNKEYTYAQLKKFEWFYNELRKKNIKINIRHIGNSAAIMELPETHFEATRPGIILYGYYPSNEVDKNKLNLKPIMTLKTNVVHIKKMMPGEYVSYGRKFKCERESIIATLPVGYADGYTRMLSGKAKVIINGNYAPVIGRICMDQCMIDITDLPSVQVGDEVVIMGESDDKKFTADDMAEIIGTINYEVICMISKRVPRVYIKNGEVVKIRNYV
ncbi:alanine racemase [Clostridium acetobutylicum]|uniref:Alanine racemase 1 n=1 Tax=Clostridium acetobutylicum (strain ATCC 824 / DSM 792 / JCM 1419 / IAM 19013 / LMG 5710 / NBRC 13948 / NRRL B-527 / VKM B-1787 / 2291 / W) TaxID=272562 RepID=ALR1_CLOAB|nr:MULTISPECIES: alanine racemase [Clostridium]Q97LR2.1 RecName: Full=Alanine racemase 1 [Clostridium acetobutylicum ATCC 824]AAK78472.1 Alanine racemase [Clostridium acetobutylicum ATCC 824]ADZ19542.1 alanine racemase [Clostridium acetobutylicum EA 2018]AEI33017.1 alanine racemase [Clostridium acetobutylicum DSM 1731]AWV80194.1 alanine racemase [Clostridium acetobutylicum]MBC2392375.1 alanine racemase [Clostridium acetobutylicum]